MMITFVAKLLPDAGRPLNLSMHAWYVVELDGDGFHIVPLDSPHRGILSRPNETESGEALKELIDVLCESGIESREV